MSYQPRVSLVHKSLLEQKMIGGVEKEFAIFNAVIAFAICFALKNLWYVPVAMLMHSILRWLYKKDPYIRKIYLRYNVLGRVYDPWPRCRQETNMRPDGFSKGMLC